jgi:hypothetical protein
MDFSVGTPVTRVPCVALSECVSQHIQQRKSQTNSVISEGAKGRRRPVARANGVFGRDNRANGVLGTDNSRVRPHFQAKLESWRGTAVTSSHEERVADKTPKI